MVDAFAVAMRRTSAAVMLANARGDYVHGRITLDELEERVGRALELDSRPPRPHDCERDGHVVAERVEITVLGSEKREFLGDPACQVCGVEP